MEIRDDSRSLPNLLYLGNVPVESSYHGSALLFRLLSDYPKEKLLILEGSTPHGSSPDRRIPSVGYGIFPAGHPSLLRWRLRIPYWTFLAWRATSWRRRVARCCGDFTPQAVLTVAHGPLWMTASAFARDHAMPLHLLCHDEIQAAMHVTPFLRPWIEKQFGEHYRRAASRLCVSPGMREDYRRRFGSDATVLYPSRSADAETHDAPPAQLEQPRQSLTIAFAGTLHLPGYFAALEDTAQVLRSIGGRLLIYGGCTRTGAAAHGLTSTNVEYRGLLPSRELVRELREHADALLVTMSFAESDRAAMRNGFPSKLADYTLAGLPLLIHGPPDCSAVAWARENPGVAEVVTDRKHAALTEALRRLSEPGHRIEVGAAAAKAGREYFSHDRAQRTLFERLTAHPGGVRARSPAP